MAMIRSSGSSASFPPSACGKTRGVCVCNLLGWERGEKRSRLRWGNVYMCYIYLFVYIYKYIYVFMYEGSVLMGCLRSVRVHLAISDPSSEITALCCPPCVYICICLNIYISKECKNITFVELLSSLLSKCVFVRA